MTARSIFITGTDTDAGKTWVCATLTNYFQQKNKFCRAIKPIVSGCDLSQALGNSDLKHLYQAQQHPPEKSQMYQSRFAPAIAPHLAAEQANQSIDMSALLSFCQKHASEPEILLIEGVGGWSVPLSDSKRLSDLPKALNCEVILVIGMRLGCINHGLLTAERIIADGCKLTGWIASEIDPNMDMFEENQDSLKQRISAPLLAKLPYSEMLETAQLEIYQDF